MSSLSVEQSKFTQQSTIKLGLSPIWVRVSSMSSLVSLGTGGSKLRGRGVVDAGVPTAVPVGVDDSSGTGSPTSTVVALGVAGVLGREMPVDAVRCTGKGAGLGGVSRSIR